MFEFVHSVCVLISAAKLIHLQIQSSVLPSELWQIVAKTISIKLKIGKLLHPHFFFGQNEVL
jgi:hypothetical protein